MSPVVDDDSDDMCNVASQVVMAFVLVMVPVHLAEAVCDAANNVGLIPIEVATTDEAITAVDNAGPENVVAAVVDVGADDTSDSVWPLLCALDQRGMGQVFVAVLSGQVYGNAQTETECFASGVQMVSDSTHDVAQALSLVSLDVVIKKERARSYGVYYQQREQLRVQHNPQDINNTHHDQSASVKQPLPEDRRCCAVCRLQALTEAVSHLNLQQSSLSVARPGELQHHHCGCAHSQMTQSMPAEPVYDVDHVTVVPSSSTSTEMFSCKQAGADVNTDRAVQPQGDCRNTILYPSAYQPVVEVSLATAPAP